MDSRGRAPARTEGVALTAAAGEPVSPRYRWHHRDFTSPSSFKYCRLDARMRVAPGSNSNFRRGQVQRPCSRLAQACERGRAFCRGRRLRSWLPDGWHRANALSAGVFWRSTPDLYAQTLKRNHDTLRAIRRQHDLTPGDLHPIDLRTPEALKEIKKRAKTYGGTHLVVGGPPCQGFSSANRNSWHGDNPHNGLVGVFLRYVDSLKPLMFLMENVQGILWTPQSGKSSTASVMAHLARRCAAMGYIVFPKLLDAVGYRRPAASQSSVPLRNSCRPRLYRG